MFACLIIFKRHALPKQGRRFLTNNEAKLIHGSNPPPGNEAGAVLAAKTQHDFKMKLAPFWAPKSHHDSQKRNMTSEKRVSERCKFQNRTSPPPSQLILCPKFKTEPSRVCGGGGCMYPSSYHVCVGCVGGWGGGACTSA